MLNNADPIAFFERFFFFFSSRRRHTRLVGDWSSDVCSSDLEAAEELRAIDLAPLRAAAKAAPAIFLVAALLDRAGDHRSAHALLKSEGRAVLRSPPVGDGIRLWRIAYPAAFRPEVVRWASAARVPADLLQALMREESALDPAVVSPAGAVGLTQLMPTTAREMARRLKLPRPSAADLSDPDL